MEKRLIYLIGGLSGRQVVVSGIQKDFRKTIRNQNAIGEINNIRELAAAETPRDNVIALKPIIQVFPHANGRTSCEYDPSFQRSMLPVLRSEEHTSELQSLMRISYAVSCLKKKKIRISKTLVGYKKNK